MAGLVSALLLDLIFVALLARSALSSSVDLPAKDREAQLTANGNCVGLTFFRAIIENRSGGIVLDTRPDMFYRAGHIPGALRLSAEEFEIDYSRIHKLLENNKAQTIVVYCASFWCQDSEIVAVALEKLGYGHVFIYKGGWLEWRKAHLPVEKS
jgi:rhodanese-related sulfurtransferase